MMNKLPIWIDTDTGVDDALAILLACKLENLDIVGSSAVAGNTSHENAFRNCRDVFNLANRKDVKVYPGSDRPLIEKLRTAASVHGDNGLGGAIIDTSDAPIETIKAWDGLYQCAKKYSKQLTVIAIGPLTNIATTIIKHPDFVDHIKQLNIMGGAADGGNITPCAEFNILVDPHAAEVVFKSGIKVNMFGLDVTHKAFIDDEEILELYNINTKAAKLFKDSTSALFANRKKFYKRGLCQHDSTPVVYMTYPEWFKSEKCGVYVETNGSITKGKTVTDLWSDTKFEKRNCEVFLDIDREKFVTLIKDILSSY